MENDKKYGWKHLLPEVDDGEGMFAMTGHARTEDGTPRAYRLARRKDGTVILQGAYFWQIGNGMAGDYGYEWREIPIVELEE